MKFTKRQQDLFNIMKGKLSRDMGRDLTKSEIEKLNDTIHTNFKTDTEADNALKTLAIKMISDPVIWDEFMNKNYPPDYEERKKKSSKAPKRKPVKKCKCK